MPDNPIRVAYVDDDPWQLEATQLLFDLENDIHITRCSSPDEALVGISRNEFDCVVTDYLMKKMSGVDLVKEIRRISNVPVIVYSMFDEPSIADAAIDAGANRFVMNNPIRRSHRILAGEIRKLVKP